MKRQTNTINIGSDTHNAENAKKLIRLLKDQGYAIISNHCVPISLLSSSLQEWKKFFSNVRKYDFIRTDTADEGYIPINIETAKEGAKADYKELYQAHYGTKLPNIINTKDTWKIFDGLTTLGENISRLIDLGLPEKVRKNQSRNLITISSGCGNHMLRVIHYPPIIDDFTKIRAEAHTDICLFTFIFGELCSGLELQNFTGKWFTIDCNNSDIIIFTSEMLEIYTDGYLKAVKHRVPTNPATCKTSRYSVPFGYHPYREAKLTDTLTAGEYLRRRLIEMGYDGTQLDLKNY